MKPAFTLAGVLVLGFLAFPVLADDPPAPGKGAQDKKLTDKQQEARQKLQALEETMNRLATLLEKTEPEHAVLLRRAYQQSKEDLILKDMDRIIQFLKDEDLDEAIQKQKDVEESLRRLLVLLLDNEDSLEDLLEKIKRLKGYKKEIERLIKEETQEKKDSDETGRLEEIAQARAALDNLIQRQEAQVGDTKGLGDAAAPNAAEAYEGLREAQEGIREETEELAFKIDDILGEEAEEGEEGSSSKAGEALEGSAGSMSQAEGNLSEMNQEGAVSKGQKALEQLKEAREAIQKEEEKLRKLLSLPDYGEMKKAQDSTRQDTGDLARKMKKEGGEEGTPGQKGVGKAGESMGKASTGLSQRNSRGASGDQQEALDQLQQAQEEVEDALEQARRELQEEVLALLEERFLKMLAQQKGISEKTIKLNKKIAAEDGPDRAQRQVLTELSGGEDDLADQSDEALELLREEGSTVVFPQVVDDMKKELVGVGLRLASAKTGEYTQAIQKEIEITLEQLIEAVRKKQQHAGSCGGCGT